MKQKTESKVKKTISKIKKELKETRSVKVFQDNVNRLIVHGAKLPGNLNTLKKKAFEKNMEALDKAVKKAKTISEGQRLKRQLQSMKRKFNAIFK